MSISACAARAIRALWPLPRLRPSPLPYVEPEIVLPSAVVSVTYAAPDGRLVLYDWLNAVIYEMAVRRMVFSRFDVSLQGGTLEGRAWGETVDPTRRARAVEPKGATMTGLKV